MDMSTLSVISIFILCMIAGWTIGVWVVLGIFYFISRR